MESNNTKPEVIDLRQPEMPKANLGDILKNPLVQEFGMPMLKMALKKELGIGTSEKEVTKKPFGRTVYAVRDFIQGTWWVALALYGGYWTLKLLFAIMSKWAGVQV